MWPNPQETADSSHLLKKSVMENFIFLCSDVNIGTLIVPQTFEKASVKDVHMIPENQVV